MAVRARRVDTVAGGLAPPFASELALEHARALVDDVVLVTDAEILIALDFLLERAKLPVEPSVAAAVAALMAGRIPIREGETVVSVLSGGNVASGQLAAWLSASEREA